MTMTQKAPIAVPLDAPDLATARRWAEAVAPHVSTLKVGLELVMQAGPRAAAEVTEGLGCDLFLDLKLHDIPNTVAGAMRSIATIKPLFVTVHALGGPDMVKAAVGASGAGILGVTILTSMDQAALAATGITGTPLDAAIRLAVMAVEAGVVGIVCSPHEIAAIRSEIPAEIIIVTPGVRPAQSAHGDQKRVMTPEDAITAGSDLLVMGRPITEAPDPGVAAATFGEGLHDLYLARLSR